MYLFLLIKWLRPLQLAETINNSPFLNMNFMIRSGCEEVSTCKGYEKENTNRLAFLQRYIPEKQYEGSIL